MVGKWPAEEKYNPTDARHRASVLTSSLTRLEAKYHAQRLKKQTKERINLFHIAQCRQRADGGTSAAEWLHGSDGLHPAYWGVSKHQLAEFVALVREAHTDETIKNPTPEHCQARGCPYYCQKKFDDPAIGPNMHLVSGQWIVPTTAQPDPVYAIPALSYALMHNTDQAGLLCDLFISHAWDEGIFEFGKNCLEAWPDECGAAYFCCLSNPQNLMHLIGSMISAPSNSPFFQVLQHGVQFMLMVGNCTTAIHTRLWW